MEQSLMTFTGAEAQIDKYENRKLTALVMFVSFDANQNRSPYFLISQDILLFLLVSSDYKLPHHLS
jgi:hypothetical protein